jgi:hypothetical protein
VPELAVYSNHNSSRLTTAGVLILIAGGLTTATPFAINKGNINPEQGATKGELFLSGDACKGFIGAGIATSVLGVILTLAGSSNHNTVADYRGASWNF